MNLAIRHILVLCEGNHCRSPMAEALLRRALGPGFTVSSAGLKALIDRPAHEDAQRLMVAQGLDISGFRGRQLTLELALGADLILVMDEAQKAACEGQIPSVRGRVFLLGHWLDPKERQIEDPYSRGPEAHLIAYRHIQRALPAWLARLNGPGSI
jgi:protein-tyrosine phosphatase